MIFHELSVIPTCNDEGKSVEISHLCYHKRCVKPQHLVLETHAMNMDRLHCKNQEFCSRGHQTHCLIVSSVIIFLNNVTGFKVLTPILASKGMPRNCGCAGWSETSLGGTLCCAAAHFLIKFYLFSIFFIDYRTSCLANSLKWDDSQTRRSYFFREKINKILCEH